MLFPFETCYGCSRVPSDGSACDLVQRHSELRTILTVKIAGAEVLLNRARNIAKVTSFAVREFPETMAEHLVSTEALDSFATAAENASSELTDLRFPNATSQALLDELSLVAAAIGACHATPAIKQGF